MSAEHSAAEMLRTLLGDVALARGAVARGDVQQDELLPVLARAAFFYPVFNGWPSPVQDWLEELTTVAARQGNDDLVHMARVRTAVVRMRLGDFVGATELLASTEVGSITNRVRQWTVVTRARVAVRSGHLDDAARLVADARAILLDDNDWLTTLVEVADAERLLEGNEIEEAEEAFLRALTHLSRELLEERILALQALGFVYISQADASNAVKYLGDARELLRGAGIWPEVIQMNLVLGALSLPLGDRASAAELFDEAIALCQEHKQPQYEGVLKVMRARVHAAERDTSAAIAATLDAAGAFAEHGQAVSYMGMIAFLSELYLRRNEPEQAYETLLTGVSIAKRLGLPRGESALRSRIQRLRQIVLGPQRFDAMVESILRRKRSELERGRSEL